MPVYQAIILGIIQGLTEFLPVSSSAHLNLFPWLLGWNQMPASFDEEALKVQSVLARTYTYKLLLNNKTITDDISVQAYKSDDELKNIWNDKYDYYSSKISKAINDTTDEVVTYNGNLIEALHHSTSNGLTEDPVNVWGNSYPYLKSVASHGDLVSPSYLRSVDISFEDINKALDIDFNK